LKKEVEIDYYKKIREIPLSEEKIGEFRNSVGKLWEENSVIISVLRSLDNVEFVPNNIEVEGYGLFQRLLKMKFAFIDGEHYQNIFGLNNFGSQLARQIDTIFFNKLKVDNVISKSDIDKTVSKFIDETENRENVVIFANWRNAD